MSALPKQVQRQVDAANRIAEEIYKPKKQPDEKAEGEPVPPTETPPDETPPIETPPTETPPVKTPAAVVQLPIEEVEHKYKTLQGKYNAEVPRLTAQVRDQGESLRQVREQLSATQTLLASLGNQREPAPVGETPHPGPAPAARLVKDEEIREFGPDLYDFIKRAAAEAVMPQVETRFETRFRPVVQQVEQAASVATSTAQKVARNDQQSVLALLSRDVPDWQRLNEDVNFLAWLDQVDPYSGYQRGDLLKQAYAAHDGPRVVAFFRGFQIEHAAVTPPLSTTPPPADNIAAPQKKLEDFVAPGLPKPGSTGTQDGSGKRVWTRAEISAFYKDCNDGKFAKRPTERTKLEADIFAAQREGRIR